MFKPIYYLGNKADFVGPIRDALDAVDPTRGRVGEVFAGTGAVSIAVSDERDVLTCDVQEYSRVLCSAFLARPHVDSSLRHEVLRRVQGEAHRQLAWCLEPLIEWEEACVASGSAERMARLLEAPPLAARLDAEGNPDFERAADLATQRLKGAGLWGAPDSTVSRLFAGVYFSYRQAAALDSALNVSNSMAPDLRDLLLAVTLSTASTVVNTVGKQFAQPIQPRSKSGELKGGFEKAVRRDRAIDVLQTLEVWLHRYAGLPQKRRAAIILRSDYESALADYGTQLSVVYADPPYTRDHYSRFYHVLETMCLRDNPEFSSVVRDGQKTVSRGLYRADRFQSDFCVRSLAPGAFERLFKLARQRDLPIVLSYSPHESGDGTHPRVVSQEQILALAKQYYSKVELTPIAGSVHNVMNSSALRLKDREHAEILVKCYR